MAKGTTKAPAKAPLQFQPGAGPVVKATDEKKVDGNSANSGKGRNLLNVELIASMKAPQSLADMITKDPKLVNAINSNEPLNFTLAQVLEMYDAKEQSAGMRDDNTYNAGGHAITYERSNLFQTEDQLIRKGTPNPHLLTNKRDGKVSNSDFVRMTDINKWPADVLNSPVSIEFNTKKKEKETDPIVKDTTGKSGLSVFFRVKANVHPISKEDVAKQQAEAQGHANYSVRSGLSVFNNSIKASSFQSFQGMGNTQYMNSAYLRQDANLDKAAQLGNPAAIRYKTMKATAAANKGDAAAAQTIENDVDGLDV